MSIAGQIGAAVVTRENMSQRDDFMRVCRYFMLGGGPAAASRLAEADRAGERVVAAIKAAVAPMSVGEFGTMLSPFQALAIPSSRRWQARPPSMPCSAR